MSFILLINLKQIIELVSFTQALCDFAHCSIHFTLSLTLDGYTPGNTLGTLAQEHFKSES